MTTPMLPLATAVAPSKSLLDYVADGGEIGLVIILLSVVGATLIVVQLIRVRRAVLAPTEDVERLGELLDAGDMQGALEYCRGGSTDSYLARVLGSALARAVSSPLGVLELHGAIEEAGQRETARLYRQADGIGLIASVAPMLGLLGTVVGMVGAFDTITLTDGPARPDQLAGNISQALVTTVLGLLVAIPCTAAYTYVRSRTDSLVSDVGETLEDLTAGLEAPANTAQGAPR